MPRSRSLRARVQVSLADEWWDLCTAHPPQRPSISRVVARQVECNGPGKLMTVAVRDRGPAGRSGADLSEAGRTRPAHSAARHLA